MQERVNVSWVSMCLVVGLLALTPMARSDESTGRVVGRVTDDEGAAVPGTMVSVMVRPGISAADVALRHAMSDPQGNYELTLPRGHARLLNVRPPAGYYADASMSEIATSAAQPNFTHDVRVQRGPAITLVLHGDLGTKSNNVVIAQSKPPLFFYVFQPAANGRTGITIPADGGTFELHVQSLPQYASLSKVELEIAPGFVTEPIPECTVGAADAQHVVVDREGRKATITGAVPSVIDGRLALEPLPNAKPEEMRSLRVTGRVLDEDNKPLSGATVGYVAARKSGGSAAKLATQSGEDGEFVLEPSISSGTGAQSPYYFLIVAAPGSAGCITASKPVPPEMDAFECEPVQLAPGHSAKIRVVDESGQPVEGAWVQPGEHYLSIVQLATTDASGRCVFDGLPLGVVPVEARFGQSFARDKIIVEENSTSEEILLRLESLDMRRAASANPIPPAPPVGSPAPAWKLVGWTDDQTRTLSDYRGKVVVLDFWGTWCSACLNAIDASKQLQAKYADNPEVVFLGIHSAGTEMNQVQALLRLKEWQLPTGLDEGSDVSSGWMARGYGARGWPTTVIIDREGRIVFNSNLDEWNPLTAERESARIAKALGLPPLKLRATVDEQIATNNRMNVFRHSELIDRALQGKP